MLVLFTDIREKLTGEMPSGILLCSTLIENNYMISKWSYSPSCRSLLANLREVARLRQKDPAAGSIYKIPNWGHHLSIYKSRDTEDPGSQARARPRTCVSRQQRLKTVVSKRKENQESKIPCKKQQASFKVEK